MNKFIKTTLLASVATLLLAGSDVLAQQNQGGQGGQRGQRGQRGQGGQGGGQFDPARMEEMRAQMQERMKENFGVTDDSEWKVIWGRIQKVQEVQQEVRGFSSFGMGRMMRPRGGGDNADTQQRPQRGGGMFGGTPNAAMEALQKAIDDNASADTIKVKLAAVREARKAADAKLDKAQADLQKVLTPIQEAKAFVAGLLK